MKFLIVKKQQGEGCDYTIGCGMRFDWIEADSTYEATHKALWPDGDTEWCSLDVDGEQELEQMLVIPEPSVTIVDVDEIARDIRKSRSEKREADEKQAELELLHKLQSKHGITK